MNNHFLSFIGHGMQFKKDTRGLSKNKNRKSLPIPVIPVSGMEEEEDVPLINSLDIMLVQEQPAIPETTGQPTPPSEKSEEHRVITILDSNRDKEEDFEMFEYSDSFGEDRQRLTDSWYGIKSRQGSLYRMMIMMTYVCMCARVIKCGK